MQTPQVGESSNLILPNQHATSSSSGISPKNGQKDSLTSSAKNDASACFLSSFFNALWNMLLALCCCGKKEASPKKLEPKQSENRKQGASEDLNFEVKLTPSKTDSSSCFGIQPSNVQEKPLSIPTAAPSTAPRQAQPTQLDKGLNYTLALFLDDMHNRDQHLETMTNLIKEGANVNLCYDRWGNTLLHVIVEQCYLSTLSHFDPKSSLGSFLLLILNEGKPNLELKDPLERTILQHLMFRTSEDNYSWRLEIAQLLIEKGARTDISINNLIYDGTFVNFVEENRDNNDHWIAFAKFCESKKIIAERAARPPITKEELIAALNKAKTSQDPKDVKAARSLLLRGAPLDVNIEKSKTPIGHFLVGNYAKSNEWRNLFVSFLSKQSDLLEVTYGGETMLAVALNKASQSNNETDQGHYVSCAHKLLNRGADLNVYTNENIPALHLICDRYLISNWHVLLQDLEILKKANLEVVHDGKTVLAKASEKASTDKRFSALARHLTNAGAKSNNKPTAETAESENKK